MLPTHWTEYDLDIDDGVLHYLRTGNGRKPPLVLVHGFSDNARCWLQTALDLEGEYDIVLPDARGHGLSARAEPDQPVDLAADLAAIIETLGIQRPIVVGHSMGAETAFQLGVRFPHIPRALILEDPPWREPMQGDSGGQPPTRHLATAVENISRSTLDELKDQARQEHPTWPDWVIDTWCPAKKQLDPDFLSVLRMNMAGWTDGVPRLTCPTLIVTADPEKGGIVTPAIAERVQTMNQKCQIVHVPDAGHHIRFEQYDAYMHHVNAFLQRLA